MDLGLLFWRICAVFSLDPQALLRFPLRLFWSAGRHLDRITAWQDLRHMQVALAVQSAQGNDSWRKIHDSLADASGVVVEPIQAESSKEDILAFTKGIK